MAETEIRASELNDGDTYAEFGGDPEIAATVAHHGDTVLITTADGTETALDADTVIILNPEA